MSYVRLGMVTQYKNISTYKEPWQLWYKNTDIMLMNPSQLTLHRHTVKSQLFFFFKGEYLSLTITHPFTCELSLTKSKPIRSYLKPKLGVFRPIFLLSCSPQKVVVLCK